MVYKTDIKGAGFDNLEIRDDYNEDGLLNIPESIIEDIHNVLNDSQRQIQMTDRNFKIGIREFGFDMLSAKLNTLIESYSDEIRAA